MQSYLGKAAGQCTVIWEGGERKRDAQSLLAVWHLVAATHKKKVLNNVKVFKKPGLSPTIVGTVEPPPISFFLMSEIFHPLLPIDKTKSL